MYVLIDDTYSWKTYNVSGFTVYSVGGGNDLLNIVNSISILMSDYSRLKLEHILSIMNYPGAFAEYVNIMERNLIQIPDGMNSNHAALTEPAATSLHAINLAEKALHRPVSEGRALVIGGGSIGLLASLILNSPFDVKNP